MKRATLITALAISALAIAGCGGKQKAKTPEPIASPVAEPTLEPAPEPKSTEVATGEVREALLSLRRVHFAYDTANLLPEARTALNEAGERLEAVPDVHVYIDGHTDERGTTEYNIALGERRARTVAEYLTRLGIAAERLHVVSFGEEKPWAGGSTEFANAKNRRAEFRLMRGDVRFVLEEGVIYDDEGNPTKDAP